jgi:hypothetical protein
VEVVEVGGSLRGTAPTVNGTAIFSPNVCHKRMRCAYMKDARARTLDSLRIRLVVRALEPFAERVPARDSPKVSVHFGPVVRDFAAYS